MPGTTHIILIGVEDYHDAQKLDKVDFAKKDVEDLYVAFGALENDQGDFTVLINNKATRTAILQNVIRITERAQAGDKIIFYFAGHGFYEGGQNFLAPVDTMVTRISETCLSIELMLGYFKKSLCKKVILFLDCCHSGFIAGTNIRSGNTEFETDELVYQFRNEQYCTGFASCNSNEKSLSSKTLQHGIWSHFLITALQGNAGRIYRKGLLFSDALQAYLNKETISFVKLNVVGKPDQTPIKFGNETDTFIVADASSILQQKQAARAGNAIPIYNITMYSGTYDSIKSLPGFNKKGHSVPSYFSSSANDFVKEKGKELVENEISEISMALTKQLGYKRKDITSSTSKGGGSIETKDFDYSIELSQEENDPGQYRLIRRLESITHQELIENPAFNLIFNRHFDHLALLLYNPIDLTALIDNIEALDDPNITVEYNPSDIARCYINIKGLDHKVEVEPDSVAVIVDYKTSPLNLVRDFKKTQTALLSHPALRLIGI